MGTIWHGLGTVWHGLGTCCPSMLESDQMQLTPHCVQFSFKQLTSLPFIVKAGLQFRYTSEEWSEGGKCVCVWRSEGRKLL